MERTDIQRKKEYPASGLFDCLYDEKFTLYNSQNNLYEFLGYNTLDEMDRLFHNYLIECIYPMTENQRRNQKATGGQQCVCT